MMKGSEQGNEKAGTRDVGDRDQGIKAGAEMESKGEKSERARQQ